MEQVPNLRYYFNAFSGALTSEILRVPGPGESIKIWGYIISTDTASTVTLELRDTSAKDGDSRFAARFYFAANDGANLAPGNAPIARGDRVATLALSSTGAGALSVAIIYQED